MSFSDPSKIGEGMTSKTSFRRPEVGLYLRFFRERLAGGCVDMVEEMIPGLIQECGWSRALS